MTSRGTLSIAVHQDCQLCETCLFFAVRRICTFWREDFDPASPQVANTSFFCLEAVVGVHGNSACQGTLQQ